MKVKFKDFSEILAGTGFPIIYQGEKTGKFPFYKVGDIAKNISQGNTLLGFCDNYINDDIVSKIKGTIIPPGSIVFAKIGEAVKLNRRAITASACLVDNNVMAIKPNEEKVDLKYFYYLLTSMKMEKYAEKTTVPSVKKSVIENLEIELQPLAEQRKIANKLDTVSSLISLRNQQLKQLDVLVKSRFVEMFGMQDYTKESLENNVEEMFIGPFGSSLKNECFVEKEKGYCMVYEQKHAIQKTMDLPTRYITEDKYQELKRFTVLPGDIIVSCRGTIGEIFAVPMDAPLGIMHPSIMKIRLKKNKYNYNFFVFALEQSLKQHEREVVGSSIKMAITATALGKEKFIIPDMEVQNNFVAFVQQVDKSKFTIKQSLEQLELLKKKLMQDYFG